MEVKSEDTVINDVVGKARLVGQPRFSHRYNLEDYYTVVVVNPRLKSKKYDTTYLTVSDSLLSKLENSLDVDPREGDILEFRGKLIPCRVSRWSDVSVLVSEISLVARKGSVEESETIETSPMEVRAYLTGELVKLEEATMYQGKPMAVPATIKVDVSDNTYVMVRMSAYGRMRTLTSKLSIGSKISLTLTLRSYIGDSITDESRNTLTDGRVLAIRKVD